MPQGALARLAAPPAAPRWLQLDARSHAPGGHVLKIELDAGEGGGRVAEVSGPGPFTLNLPLAGPAAPTPPLRWTLRCTRPYVPAEFDPASNDARPLTFRLEAARWRR